jgi:hypothetical protein
MRRNLIGAAAIVLCAGLAWPKSAPEGAMPVEGTWSLNNWKAGESVGLTLSYQNAGTHWRWQSDVRLADVTGLTAEQLHAAHVPVQFAMKRDAGTFAFTGVLVLGLGHGDYRFTPDPSYLEKLAALGFAVGDDDSASIMKLVMSDVSLACAGEVKRLGLRGATVSDLLRLRDHGVDVEFVQGLTAAGRHDLTVDDLVNLRDHGVDPKYLARIQTAGFNGLTVDQVIKLHDHGVD